jgi:small subunit ribosomal protein S6
LASTRGVRITPRALQQASEHSEACCVFGLYFWVAFAAPAAGSAPGALFCMTPAGRLPSVASWVEVRTLDRKPAHQMVCEFVVGVVPEQGPRNPQGVFMRHYEIILLIHPDQSEQVPAMLERYKTLVTNGGGKVHRVEDWGRRQLAYMIQKLAKAHYLCLNIECTGEILAELETGFRFNDAVLRHLTVAKRKADTTPSVMMKAVEREESRKTNQEAQA